MSRAAPTHPDEDRIALDYGLRAQVRLLPYALGFFGIGLPVYVWAALAVMSVPMLGFNLLLFAGLWLAFFLLKPGLAAEGATETLAPGQIETRLRRQWLCGGLWSLGLLAVSLSAMHSGPEAAVLLIVCAGAATGVVFFSAPVLIFLLTLGPLAMAGPIIALNALHQDEGQFPLAHMVTAGLSLSLAFGLVLNRHLRQHYLLEYRQLKLLLDREQALKVRDELSHAQMAMMQTLSREVISGLRGLEQNLSRSLSLMVRAPAQRQPVEQALATAGHIRDMIVTTVDDGSIRQGHLDVVAVPFAADALLKDVSAAFAPLAKARGLEYRLDLPPEPLTGAICADPQRLRQIVSHLLANAIGYTPSGRVSLSLMPPVDGFIRIEVADTGPGLDEAELARAFAPFERIRRTSSGHPGAGVGLNLSRALAELMGGRLEAWSAPGLGSRFWVDLPFDPHAVLSEPETPVIPAPEVADPGMQTVLLLSDDALEAAQLRDRLEQLGHRCLNARTRARALSLAEKGSIDAFLMVSAPPEDLSLPGQRAKLEAWLARLRQTQTATRLKILALLPEGGQAESLSELGVRPLLAPFSAEVLQRALIRTDVD